MDKHKDPDERREQCGSDQDHPAAGDAPLPEWAKPLVALRDSAPLYVAAPVDDLLHALREPTQHPRWALWCVFETAEAIVRFLAIAALAELVDSDGRLPESVSKALRSEIERPTFAIWRRAFEEATSALPTSKIMPELASSRQAVLGLFESESAIIACRNQVAHGVAITRELAKKQLERFGALLGQVARALSWLTRLEVRTRDQDGLKLLRGPSFEGTPIPISASSEELEPGEIVLRYGEGEQVLWLAPFGRHGAAVDNGPALAQIFMRREREAIWYALIGSENALQSAGDNAALKRFIALFALDAWRHGESGAGKMPKAYQERGFEDDVAKDAKGFVGREDDVEALHKAIRDTSSGALWISGQAGMGKSMLLARVFCDLREEKPEERSLLIYRFREGDARCASLVFYHWLIERISPDDEGAFFRTAPTVGELRERAKSILKNRAQPIVLFLDGLDEIARREPSFCAEALPALISGTGQALFVLAGRPTGDLSALMTRIGAVRPLQGDLRPMCASEIRAMIDERMPVVAKRFVRNDMGDEEVHNDFVAHLTERSQGLPIYVTLVLQDIARGAFHRFDKEDANRLPNSVDAYFERTLQQGGFGDVSMCRQYVVCFLALALAPLSACELAALIRPRLDCGDRQEEVTREALADLAYIVTEAQTSNDEPGYRLYHASLAKKVKTWNGITAIRKQSEESLSATAGPSDDAATPYLLRFGVQHLLNAGRGRDAAERLSDVPHQMHRLRVLAPGGGDGGIGADWRLLLECTTPIELTPEQADWQRFWATDGARFAAEPGAIGARDFAECVSTYAPDTTIGSAAARDPSALLVPGMLTPLKGWNRRRRSPELAVFYGHTAGVNGAIELSGGRILSWSNDNTLRLWSSDGTPVAQLAGHTSPVRGAIELSGGRILSWSDDNTLRLWSSDGTPVAQLAGHTDAVEGAIALSGDRILSWSWDGILRLWSSDGTPVAQFAGHTERVEGAIALSGDRILSWSLDGILRLWSSDGTTVAQLAGDTEWIRGAVELSDGRILSWSRDGTLRLWNSDGTPVAQLAGHTDSVEGAIALSDGRILSWSRDGTLRLWNSDGTPVAQLAGHTDAVWDAVELSDGRILSRSSDDTLRLWSSDGTPVAQLAGHADSVWDAVELSDGRILSRSRDGTLRLWSSDGTPVAQLAGHTDAVMGTIELSGGRILSWSLDGTLRLWSSDGTPVAQLAGDTEWMRGAITLSGDRILSWSRDDTLRLWSSDGTPVAQLAGHADSVWGAVELSDGRILSWSRDGTLRLWSSDGTPVAQLAGHTDAVEGAIALSDGRILSWSRDGTLRLWSSDGTPVAQLAGHTDAVMGTIELSGGRILSWSLDGTLRLWSSDGTPVAQLAGDTELMRGAIALSGDRILSWSLDGTLRLWSSDGTPVAQLAGDTEWMRGAIALSGDRILSWSSDSLRLWSSDGTPVAQLAGHTKGAKGAIELSGGRILSWSRDGTLRLWSSDGTPVAQLAGHTSTVMGAIELTGGRILSWSDDNTLRLWAGDGQVLGRHLSWSRPLSVVLVTKSLTLVTGSQMLRLENEAD